MNILKKMSLHNTVETRIYVSLICMKCISDLVSKSDTITFTLKFNTWCYNWTENSVYVYGNKFVSSAQVVNATLEELLPDMK